MSEAFTFIENLNEPTAIPPDSILSRTLVDNPHLKLVLFHFAPGQQLSEHTASMPAVLHILDGDATLTLGDETREAQAGSWVFMPAHLNHAVVAKTPLVMLLQLIKPGRSG